MLISETIKILDNLENSIINSSDIVHNKWQHLVNLIKDARDANPYDLIDDNHTMWDEQININFPILYMASIYLYKYATKRNCNTFLFATRDCSHWHKIFKKLFPQMNVVYFHCSRNMFESATIANNSDFKNYVKSIVTDIDKTIYIDIHGTGKRMFEYFEKEFGKVLYCFLLSATHDNYSAFPDRVKHYIKNGKLENMVFDIRGSPIEMLNYDKVGTLQTYNSISGPIRDNPEYDIKLIKPYHKSIKYILKNMSAFDTHLLIKNYKSIELKQYVEQLFSAIQNEKPILAKYIKHISKHTKKTFDFTEIKDLHQKVEFEKILSSDTIHGIVWEGTFDKKSCAIKIVKLNNQPVVGPITNPQPVNENETNYKQKSLLHKLFGNKKPMRKNDFLREIREQDFLNSKKLAPKVYGFWIYTAKHKKEDLTSSDSEQYGILVMEKMDSSLKNLLLKRSLTERENKLIEKIIRKLHVKNEICHGDLKPSNIGINFNSKGKIKKCLFIDCQKIKHKNNLNEEQFSGLIEKDLKKYKLHSQKNIINRF